MINLTNYIKTKKIENKKIKNEEFRVENEKQFFGSNLKEFKRKKAK